MREHKAILGDKTKKLLHQTKTAKYVFFKSVVPIFEVKSDHINGYCNL